MASYWYAAYGRPVLDPDKCFYLSKEQLLGLHRQLYTEDSREFKPPTDCSESKNAWNAHRNDANILQHWMAFCEQEHQLHGLPLNFSFVMPPAHTTCLPHQRVQQFYREYMLPLVQE
ncbi:g7783 [Coccomyxa elongata]